MSPMLEYSNDEQDFEGEKAGEFESLESCDRDGDMDNIGESGSDDEDETRAVEKMRQELPSLRSETSALTQTLADLSVEESAVTDQVRSLKYALQLTRGEVERRQRANSELHTAYRTPVSAPMDSQSLSQVTIPTMSLDTFASQTVATGDAGMSTTTAFVNTPVADESAPRQNNRNDPQRGDVGTEDKNESDNNKRSGRLSIELQQEEVQRLEEELLNAKRDAANAVFEVETLSSRLKRLRETKGTESGPTSFGSPKGETGKQGWVKGKTAIGNSGSGSASGIDMLSRSPRTSSIPGVSSLPKSMSPITNSGVRPTVSPSTRSARLIGDVDALVGFSDEHFAAGRLGVAASGRLALYSYASADAIAPVDADVDDLVVHELDEDERDGLRKSVLARHVRMSWVTRQGAGEVEHLDGNIGNNTDQSTERWVLAGLVEATSAAAVMMDDYAKKEVETA